MEKNIEALIKRYEAKIIAFERDIKEIKDDAINVLVADLQFEAMLQRKHLESKKTQLQYVISDLKEILTILHSETSTH